MSFRPLMSRRSGAAVAMAFLLTMPSTLAAQRASQEFTRQIILLAPFEAPGGDPRPARRVAALARGLLQRRVDRATAYVFGSDSSEVILQRAGFLPGDPVDEKDLVIVARRLRTDELVVGTVVPGGGGAMTVRAELVLIRDIRRRQPLPVIRATSTNAAADTLVRHILRARTQMTGVRRCENLSRDRRADAAVREAEGAIRTYPASTLARLCLAEVLIASAGKEDSARQVAEAVLAVDSANIIATVIRAQAHQARGRVEPASESWARALALRGDSLELAVAGIEQLIRLERPLLAVNALDHLLPLHPGDTWLRRQRFRALHELARWEAAASLGDSLDTIDAEFRADSNYAVRHVEALRYVGDTLGAVARSARAARQHPGDARLYLQYVQLVGGEGGVALLRGLARFPASSELRVLAAQSARASGDRNAERTALALAAGGDASMGQAWMRVAELWFLDGMADSALAALARAPRTGAGAATLRTYALGKGVQLLRAATDTAAASYRLPLALLALADSVESREDTRSLLAAAGLQEARSELVSAARLAERADACTLVRRADFGLQQVRTQFERGIGEGTAAQELLQAHEGLRAAVDESIRRGCG